MKLKLNKQAFRSAIERKMGKHSLRVQYSIVAIALSVLAAASILSIILPFITD